MFGILRMCGLCKKSKERTGDVMVKANDPEYNSEYNYPTNFIKTSKYTILTFIPLNIFYQFRKVSNFYFLVNMIISLIPGVSPLNPATAVVPLIFVVGVALIKDGFEDYQRHKADKKANSVHAHVVRKQSYGYELTEVQSKDVQVGDIIKITLGEEVRADVLLFSSSIAEGQAFIDTCNLDGETNLKNRKAVEPTWEYKSVEEIVKHQIILRTSQPDPGLLSWTGVLTIDGKETAVGLDQFLYRSSVLRNTDFVWGMVVYAGVDTKMFRNLQEKPPKSSNLDKKLNYLIIAVLIIQLVIILIMATASVVWTHTKSNDHWYIEYYTRSPRGPRLWIYRVMAYFILMSYLIPISLFVTIELCKVAQAKLMSWDVEMFEFMHGEWHGCIPNTSNLNEELCRVSFIFTDKTGTLTENVMTYKQGDVLGNAIYADDFEPSREYFNNEDKRPAVESYFRALALCHTIQPFDDPERPGELKYEGASPDEVALVDAAKEHGIVLKERTTRSMVLEVLGEEIRFEILATLEFTPDRKMMSIIVKDPKNGKIHLYTKGADSFVIPQLHDQSPNSEVLPDCINTLRDMSSEGLRTLLVCTKEITQEEFDAWHKEFIEAGKILKNRSARVDEVCLKMEVDLTILGITAIEDRLQDKVPETLKFFLEAKVIVWMLTGDKRETAVTIAATSSLADPQEDYIDHLDIGDEEQDSAKAISLTADQLKTIESHLNEGNKRCTFVVDGPALTVCMKHHFDKFLELSQKVNSAVCCRLTPLQKAKVVKMFQESTGKTALAIGDGANDVSMIQEGKVGIGIVGLEGAQAALAADYAIPRFKHLRRLCAVHGRYALVRNALCILVSFYKNIVLAMTQFYFSFFNNFSGTSLYDGWMLSFYNLAFTSIPPLFIGIFQKDLDENALCDSPKLYPPLRLGAYLGVRIILQWFIESLLHSVVLFFIFYPFGLQLDLANGYKLDMPMYGSMIISVMITLALGKITLHVRYWVWMQVFAMVLSMIVFVGFMFLYASIPNFFGDTSFYWTTYTFMADPKYWFYMLLFVVGLLIPIDMSIIFAQKKLRPTLRDIVQEEYSRLM